MVKPLYWYLVFTLFRPEIASNSQLLLHACTGLKSVFLGFVCRKGPPFTKNKSSDISTLWWFLAMPRGKGVIGVFFWCSFLLMVSLPMMIGICGSLMVYAWLISSMIIGHFLIWFLPTSSLVLVLMSILQSVEVLFMHPILWFHICGSITCYSLLCS